MEPVLQYEARQRTKDRQLVAHFFVSSFFYFFLADGVGKLFNSVATLLRTAKTI